MRFGLRSICLLLPIIGAVWSSGPAAAEDLTPIRVGWQPTSIISAQAVHVMMKTDVMKRNGLKGEFTMFTLGPPVNEALVSNAIDVGLVGDMPSISLAAAGAPVVMVGRQTSFATGILSSTKSNIKTVADLKGTKLYGPYGTSAYLSAQNILEANHLTPGKDVEMINLAFGEIKDALQSQKIQSFYMWEPWVTFFEKRGLARVLGRDPHILVVIVMRKDFVEKHPQAVINFLKAQKEAMLFAAQNHSLVNKWFLEPANSKVFDEQVVEAAAMNDPQWSAKSLKDIKVAISPEEMKRYLREAEQVHELKIFPKPVALKERVDNSFAEKVDAMNWDFDPKSLKITQ